MPGDSELDRRQGSGFQFLRGTIYEVVKFAAIQPEFFRLVNFIVDVYAPIAALISSRMAGSSMVEGTL